MIHQADIRFKAAGRQTIEADEVEFPFRLQILRPSTTQALAEARRIIELLSREIGDAPFFETRLSLSEPIGEWSIEQKSAREVRLQVKLALWLGLKKAGTFWDQATAIASTADFLQGFATRGHDKSLEITVLQARVLGQPAQLPSMDGPVPPQSGA